MKDRSAAGPWSRTPSMNVSRSRKVMVSMPRPLTQSGGRKGEIRLSMPRWWRASDCSTAIVVNILPTLATFTMTSGPIVLRSLKGVYKASAVGPWFGLGPSPDPGPGAGVELGGGHPGGAGDLVGVGEGLPGQRLAAEDPPPGFLQVQPAGARGDEGVADAGVACQPGPGVVAVVAGEVAGDHVDGALGVGVVGPLQEVLVGGAVAGLGAHGDRLSVGDAQPAVDPGLVRPAGVLQRRLDPVPAG